MNHDWKIRATLDHADGGFRLFMAATREIDGRTEQTSDMVMVDHPAEARLACQRFAEALGVDSYVLDDRRKGAA
jgi:hypothetical protein